MFTVVRKSTQRAPELDFLPPDGTTQVFALKLAYANLELRFHEALSSAIA